MKQPNKAEYDTTVETLESTSSSSQQRAITTTTSWLMVDFLSRPSFDTPRPAIPATMLRAKSVRWRMKWPRQRSESIDLGAHSLATYLAAVHHHSPPSSVAPRHR